MTGTTTSTESSAATAGDPVTFTAGPLVARRINNAARPFAVINQDGPFGDEIVAGHLSEGDATLYAAAPDLLRACEDCMENRGDWAAVMGAAISKARGKQ